MLVPLAVTFLCYLLFHVVQFAYRELTSPLRHVVGPKNPSFVLGNFNEMAQDPGVTQRWRNEFGATFQFKGLFSISELHTSDLKAINHIINNNAIYQKAEFTRTSRERFVGKGLLGVEMDEHKRHRQIMNPAFGVAQIRAVTEIFVEKAVQLRDIWAHEVTSHGRGVESDCTIEVLSWLRRMTLDVIGQAGFSYEFNALESRGTPNELSQVLTELLHSPHARRYAPLRLAQSIVPVLRLVPMPGRRILNTAHAKMHAIGAQIVSQSKARIRTEGDSAQQELKTLAGRRDLLSVLLKANVSPTVPENQRLTEQEVIAQIPTFFVAGHETTSSAAAWALHALSLHPAVQSKLRAELLTVETDNPTMDELNALPYLDSVVRETMRVHSPAVHTQRCAVQDDVLPLAKPYIDQEGKAHHSLPIRKGQLMYIPILAVNTDTEIWGEDAREFKPERWQKIPEGASAIPGVWSNLFTFFAGPHNCIGFRFALVEMKAILFTLLRAFEFANAIPKGRIGIITTGIVQRPAVLDESGKAEKSGLPLILKPVDSNTRGQGLNI
ncbi:cytochrome P450 [Mycena crocata]|nr:cytochrome P450 [Mycena crocata]